MEMSELVRTALLQNTKDAIFQWFTGWATIWGAIFGAIGIIAVILGIFGLNEVVTNRVTEKVEEKINDLKNEIRLNQHELDLEVADANKIKQRLETRMGELENLINARISQQFAEPRIRETFQEVAENQASKMLRGEIQPAVDRFRDNLQREYQMLSAEFSRVKLLNSLPIYGDKAILEGDRGALNEINRIAQAETEMNPLKKAAIEEIRRVKNWYTPGFGLPERIQFLPPLTVILEDGTVKVDVDIPTSRLVMGLSDSDWKVRAKAASLLGQRKQKGVPDILLRVCSTDTRLEVVTHAVLSFRSLVELDKHRGLFGPRRGLFGPRNDIFNIEELEQWWQAHSTEVNERLSPRESQ